MSKISLKKFWKRLSRKQKIILSVVVVLGVAGAAFALTRGSEPSEPEQPPEPIYSQLMGIEVEKDVAERPVLGVMIENHPDARPQTGLSSAGIVFEAVAEGGITRYLALFQENTPKELGPIRSVRAYYVDWAMGFDASIAHVGGSADALDLLEQRDAKTLSQFRYPEPYYRVNLREAPHNMYATTEALRKLMDELGHESSQFDEIARSADSPAQTPQASSIKINYSYSDFTAEFRYQKETNSYVRYLAGKPDVDAATNQPITVKNLVVLKMTGPQSKAIGNGEALLFKDGNVQTIEWRQTSFRDRVRLTDAQGNDVQLNRGSTWFAALPSSGSVSHQ